MYAIRSLAGYIYQKGYECCRRCKKQDESNDQAASKRSAELQGILGKALQETPAIKSQRRIENLVKIRQELEELKRHPANQNLPLLIMCRIPKSTHLDFLDTENDGQTKIPPEVAKEIKQCAQFLIQNGTEVDHAQVEEFLAYQTELESKLSVIWNKIKGMSERDKFGQGIDPGKRAFQELAEKYKMTSNPFIRMINNEFNLGILISDNEREVCRFAAELLPQLDKIAREEEKVQPEPMDIDSANIRRRK